MHSQDAVSAQSLTLTGFFVILRNYTSGGRWCHIQAETFSWTCLSPAAYVQHAQIASDMPGASC